MSSYQTIKQRRSEPHQSLVPLRNSLHLTLAAWRNAGRFLKYWLTIVLTYKNVHKLFLTIATDSEDFFVNKQENNAPFHCRTMQLKSLQANV